MTKSGVYTTEFWITVVTTVLSFLVAFNVLSSEEAETWKGMIVALIPGVITLVMYIWSRTRVKQHTAG
jgi:heme/copper-type cytochrome/quinol oxidase subunit 4